MNKAIEKNIQVLGVPILTILGIVLAFFLVGNLVYGKISELLLQNDVAQKMSTTLKNKLSSLQANQSQVSDLAQSLTNALPAANTSLETASQLKLIAAENVLTLQNFSSGQEVVDGGIMHVDIVFDAEGQADSILNFLVATNTIAPINKVKRLKLTGGTNGGPARANVLISSYWAQFPTKIPAVSDPLQDITPEEQTLLTQLTSLRQPQFVELSPEAGGKADPFSSL